MAPAFWLGVFWRGATTAGAWTATLMTAATWWLTSLGFVAKSFAAFPAAESLGVVAETNGSLQVTVPWQMLAYLTAGFASGILISLWTKKNDPEQLNGFFELLRTPVQPNEIIETPCKLPAGVVPAPRRVLFPSSNLEIPIPSYRGMAGFLVGWVLVFAIIGSVWLIVS